MATINWTTVAITTLRATVIAWLIIFALVYFGQRKLMYMPFGGETAPADVGLPRVKAERLALASGDSIVTWYWPSAASKPTIIYFHGNGGSLALRDTTFKWFMGQRWGFYAPSYPGFSGSSGRPTEATIIAAAVAAYDALRAKGVAASDIILYGESLGTGVAIQVASQRPSAAVILEAPYSSVVDVAADRFWYLPVRLAISDTFDSVTHIRRVKAPVLILAGTRDAVIPVTFAQKLAAATGEPKRYLEYANGHHLNLLAVGGLDAIKSWVERYHVPTK
jgi:uncharacterized protein